MNRYLVFAVLLLSACSQQQVYQAVQENRLASCQKRVAEQRDRCVEEHNMPYAEYRREREALREAQ